VTVQEGQRIEHGDAVTVDAIGGAKPDAVGRDPRPRS